MDRLVEKLLDLSYEWFGILMPGLIFLVFLGGSLFFSGLITGFTSVKELEGIYQVHLKYIWFSVFFVGMVSHFGGQFLKWISKMALDPVTAKLNEKRENWRSNVPTVLRPLTWFFGEKELVKSYTDVASMQKAMKIGSTFSGCNDTR